MSSWTLAGSRCRRRVAIWLGGIWVLVASSPSWAVQLAYEPFELGVGPGEYQVGPLVGQPTVTAGSFFNGPWDGAPGQESGQVVQSLGGAPETPGGSVTAAANGRAGRYLAEPWTDGTSGVFYLSYLARYGTVADPNASGGIELGYRTTELWPAGNGVGQDTGRTQIGYNAFVGTPEDRSPNTARLKFESPAGDVQYLTSTTFNEDNNSPHRLVLKFELSDQPGADAISVFLDPIGATEPAFPNGFAGGLDFTLGAIGTISYFATEPTGGTPPTFDELRVGTTFADVQPPLVPEGPCSGPEVGYACYLEIISHMHLAGSEVSFGDLNKDGRVTIADYRVWKDNRTDLTPGAGALLVQSVPEPGTWLIGCTLTTILVGHAGRPRRVNSGLRL
jgi:hypothetical protein